MTYIGVFHEIGNYTTFYTCCCRVQIRFNQDYCPNCQKRVIPNQDREHFTRGDLERAKQARFLERYMRSGKYEAGIVAARLKGEKFIPPTLCRFCGEPNFECFCISLGGRWRCLLSKINSKHRSLTLFLKKFEIFPYSFVFLTTVALSAAWHIVGCPTSPTSGKRYSMVERHIAIV